MSNLEFDITDVRRCYFKYWNICGPVMSEKAQFLSNVRDYFADDTAYCRKESKEGDGSDQFLHSERGKHRAISLDFSDYSIRTYEDAMQYFKRKMSDLYISRLGICEDLLYGCHEWRNYLDVVEGLCDETDLTRSLLHMVLYLREKHNVPSERPMIFINEISAPLLFAEKYGYFDKLKAFYDGFLDIDHYELTGGIITTSYAPANTDVKYNLKYIQDVPVNVIPSLASYCESAGMRLDRIPEDSWYRFWNRHFDEQVGISDCYYRWREECGDAETGACAAPSIQLTDEQKTMIKGKREWIIECEEENKRQERLRMIEEKT